MNDREQLSDEAIKSCCANIYEHPLVQQLIGDSFHPGGTALTEKLGTMLGLDSSSKVLDVASGKGTSAIHLAKVFGCQVIGIDLSQTNVDQAGEAAKSSQVDKLVTFRVGDAEQLAIEDSNFDAVICECALCTFPNKPQALSEFFRVLRPGGKVGISDLTKSGELCEELQSLLAWVACIADALPADDYLNLLRQAGFNVDDGYTPVNETLNEMVANIQKNLIGAKVLQGIGKLELPKTVNLDEALKFARAARNAIEDKVLGYGVFVGIKSDLA